MLQKRVKYVQFSFDTGEIQSTMKIFLLTSTILLVGFFPYGPSHCLAKPNADESSEVVEQAGSVLAKANWNKKCPTIKGKNIQDKTKRMILTYFLH